MSEDIKSEGKAKSDSINISIKNPLPKIRENPWILATVVLGAILIVMLFVRGSGVTGNVISEKDAGDKLLSFIESQGSGGNASISSVVQENGLYKVNVLYNGEDVPVYVTLDGNFLVANPVPLNGNSVADSGTNTKTNNNESVKIEVGDAPVLGSKTAKVTVVEFSDFSCPYCAAASGDSEQYTQYMKQNNPNWEPIVTNLIKDYVNTGKVQFAVKYTMGHSGGKPAQLVAWCLNDQNLYWKFYPKAYAAQSDVEDLSKMTALAKTVGADMTKVQSCLDSKKYDSRFNVEQAESSAAGVQGTPAFFVNGILVEGAQPYSVVKQLVEQELAKAA